MRQKFNLCQDYSRLLNNLTNNLFISILREIKNLDGQIIAQNGNINCWKNLGADDQTDLHIVEVDFYDVCYTRRETSVTNTTEETVIRRGVFYGQVASANGSF